MQYFLGLLDRLLTPFSPFEWEEVPLTPGVRARAMQYIPAYSLGAHDAVLVASAMEAGVLDLASLDEGFRRVDGLYLWNDMIHSTPRGAPRGTVPPPRGCVA